MAIAWEQDRYRDLLLVRLIGELDVQTAESVRQMLQEELAKGTVKYLVLNLERLPFMDSSGLGVILGRYKTLQALGGKLLICGANPTVRRLLELSGVFKVSAVFETEEEALQSMGVMTREK